MASMFDNAQVWVLFKSEYYGAVDVIGVYSTEAKAEQQKTNLEKIDQYHEFEIQTYEVE